MDRTKEEPYKFHYLWNWWAYICQMMNDQWIDAMNMAIFDDLDTILFGEDGLLMLQNTENGEETTND